MLFRGTDVVYWQNYVSFVPSWPKAYFLEKIDLIAKINSREEEIEIDGSKDKMIKRAMKQIWEIKKKKRNAKGF